MPIAHATVLAALSLLIAPAQGPVQTPSKQWKDNERQFKSSDPRYSFRRSEHFRIMWGKGVGEGNSNGDFGHVTEQLAQANLQMLEQVWHRYHDMPPKGLGLHIPDKSSNGKVDDGESYRVNLVMNNTGVWEGGAWGTNDDWGLALFALPPTYLAYDPLSGATPHEYGHTVFINAGGFDDTPWDGMWHEEIANWVMMQFDNFYPGPGAVGTQPYLSVPHGRNYYDTWQIWEVFREDPIYGSAFVNKVWCEAHGNRAKGGEYMFDEIARLAQGCSADSYNAVKDKLGQIAARSVTWDYERGPFFRLQSPRSSDFFSDVYRRGYTELERVSGRPGWYRVPFAHAPMQGGYNIVPIALNGKSGGNYKVTVDFEPLWDCTRESDWRATLVAVDDQGEPRYSAGWNQGLNSITLSKDENKLYLTVSATPDFMPFDGFSHPSITDLPLQPQPYEVRFVDTKAGPYESKSVPPAGVAGKSHANGGGFVADSAQVDATAYVGPHAMVLGRAQVLGRARIEDYAVVTGSAVVKDEAVVSGHALVKDGAQVYGHGKVRDWATVGGAWKVFENGRALERAFLSDRGELHGNATIGGNAQDFGGADVNGHALKEGDCSNGVSADHQVLTGWVWGADPDYAAKQPDNQGLYCAYEFQRVSPLYAKDLYGDVHGYLVGEPPVHVAAKPGLGSVRLNGRDQYVELRRDVADFRDATVAVWVKWDGTSADQAIWSFGDGRGKLACLTPKGSKTGKLTFAICASDGAPERSIVADSPLPRGRWTHVAATFNGGTIALLVNGRVAASRSDVPDRLENLLGPNCLDGDDCNFLGRGPAGDYFQGELSDFRVYVEPQSQAAISALAAHAPDDFPTPVVSRAAQAGECAFLTKPTLHGTSATMSAVRDPDAKEFSYRFLRSDGKSSGWISTNWWTDCDLVPGKSYSYRVECMAREGISKRLSSPATLTVPASHRPPTGAFASAPRGVGPTVIAMTAAAPEGYEVEFVSDAGVSSGRQMSRTWIDRSVTPGARRSYTVQYWPPDDHRAGSHVSGWASQPMSAVARDDTPPARYKIGEWMTRPISLLDNTVIMKAMSVTGENGCPKIENDPVEYYFKCVEGAGPDSGWIGSPGWRTPALPDGRYLYAFKIRDTSPQHNETGYSEAFAVVVSPMTGYHGFALSQVASEPEGTLVSFTGTVAEVAKDHYVVESGAAKVNVVPQTKGDSTDPSLLGKAVTVKGCVWIVDGEERVTWAEVK